VEAGSNTSTVALRVVGGDKKKGSLESERVNMVVGHAGLGSENECAGVGQQQLQMIDPSSRQRGCYIRTTTAGVHLRKNILAESLKGLGAKAN
jgi:hypothetical protein